MRQIKCPESSLKGETSNESDVQLADSPSKPLVSLKEGTDHRLNSKEPAQPITTSGNTSATQGTTAEYLANRQMEALLVARDLILDGEPTTPAAKRTARAKLAMGPFPATDAGRRTFMNALLVSYLLVEIKDEETGGAENAREGDSGKGRRRKRARKC